MLINYLDQKIRQLFIGILVLIFIIIIRLFYLQIYNTDLLCSKSKKNFIRIKKILLPRGNIVDANNHILVTNRPVYNIFWQGTGNKNLNENQFLLLKKIEKIIGKEFLNEDLLKIKSTEKYSKILQIQTDITFEQLSKILEQTSHSNNIYIETNFKRFYPHESIACHIVGYLSHMNSETIGKMGLEKLFEDQLKGQAGEILNTINSVGKNLSREEIKQPKPGKNIITTIDIHLQKIAEAVFPENYKGALIIMDPENGAIKTILSRPTFNPATFLNQLTDEEWNEIQEKQPFLNRAFNACYPPASIFKLITTSAALELGITHQDSKWFCQGFMNFGNRNYFCSKQHNHGLITTQEAVAKSCNTFFYNIAKRLHIDDLAAYANKFGLGEKTGIIFAEKNGLVPTPLWKYQTFKEHWWPGETLSVVIGQSYLLVTPIQIARFICSIFTGYLVKPRLLEEEEIKKVPLDIKHETLEFLKQSMKTVVTTGTGHIVSKIKDIIIYAKTGTAQTCALSKGESEQKYIAHAWFVSNFAYKNQKPYIMVIIIEHAGTSSIPIATARNLLLEYRKLCRENENIKN